MSNSERGVPPIGSGYSPSQIDATLDWLREDAIGCAHHRAALNGMAEKVNEMHQALIGDYKRPGIVRRLEDLERDRDELRVRTASRFGVVTAVVVSLLSAAFTAITTYFQSRGHKP